MPRTPSELVSNRRIAAYVVIVALACIALLAIRSSLGYRTVATNGPSTLTVTGNKLYDNGHQVIFHGVNRSGTEYACHQGWGIFDGASDSASVAAIAAWGNNMVRVPLNEDCWLGINGLNPAYSGLNYRNAITAYVTLLRQAGMYVQLSLQTAGPGSSIATTILPMPDADHAADFWRSVATTFGGDRGVVFDLYNEPHDIDWPCWANGCQVTSGYNVTAAYQAVGFKALTAAVRATGAPNVIVVPGIGWSYDISGWLANKPADSQLIAGVHNYGGNNYNTAAAWNAQYAPVNATVPVELGEIGFDGYIQQIMPWADSLGIGYMAWTWDTWGCCQSLISSYSGAPTTYGTNYKNHLATLPPTPAPAPSPTTQPAPAPTSAAPSPSSAPAPSPLPSPASASQTMRYDFEDGTLQAWQVAWGSSVGVSNSTAVAFSGSHSLAVKVAAVKDWPAVDVQSGPLTGIAPGVTVTFHVYSAGSTTVSLTPFAYDGSWRARFGKQTALAPGWNTLTFALPKKMSGVSGLGLQINNPNAWGGQLFVDAVTTG